MLSHTAKALPACHASCQAFQPACVRLRFLESNGVALLQDFVDGDEGFEGLHFVREDWLPELVISCGS
jgi:hypothetical protein